MQAAKLDLPAGRRLWRQEAIGDYYCEIRWVATLEYHVTGCSEWLQGRWMSAASVAPAPQAAGHELLPELSMAAEQQHSFAVVGSGSTACQGDVV